MNDSTPEDLTATFSRILGASARPSGVMMGAGNDDLASGREYLEALAPGGWAVPTWPREFGGRGASKVEAASIARALQPFAPDLYPYGVGLHLVGPTILEYGTPAQREKWLRHIADGSSVWCQMFSEPGAGSDLASVSTKAERDGDVWRLSGQKVWTSRASYAQMGLCLARTDRTVRKHRGMTMFAVEMDAHGVGVRPLVQMNGDRHFSEVFLDEVVVPDANRIGGIGDGWQVALSVLSHEHANLTTEAPARSSERVPSWLRRLVDDGLLADAVRRDQGMALFVEHRIAQLTAMRASALARSGQPGPEGSGQKLRWATTMKRRSYFVNTVQGASGMLRDQVGHMELITAPSLSIRGGTDEIQRNIIGERVLGLPAEPRLDRDVPFIASSPHEH